MSTSARQPLQAGRKWIARAVSIGLPALVVLAACGGSTSSSSKPDYCTARANLQNAVQQATSLTPTSGVSALQAAFKKVQADANVVVSKAKNDFPSQTSAIKSSIDALAGVVNTLPANPSAGQIAAVVSKASDVVSSVTSFTNASRSKCG